ncbi:50S ribosomal protein L39e [archaeon CG_4_10_14_0_2_um_filter_Archaea_38_6]|nr:MAG: 50S ribosomal protein L39e [archaeon CG07_land_8_20_14_0_80_38_8]PIU88304.1 MAG: 50S ribosomal protein L39e [archaeon CG06_land_8_20_14_3_00_37_11]PIX42635.1 MAG: 50S ribosomal protein L39e [archaeon CG_4_8_14_3_um_filter_38_5]PJA22945.1 MAG: 50S ribosomal protein L39e [archaeon CG_4_10_14_0_2_um_filter_Archaea_38_6]
MASNKPSSLKTKLASAKRRYRVAPRWVILKKYGGLKRSVHISSWRANPKMRRNWRRNKLKIR